MDQGRDEIPVWSFADRLRKLRSEYNGGLTQKEMAREIGVNAGAYSQWEAGRALPRGGTLDISRRLSALTGVPVWWIMGLKENELGRPDDRRR